MPGSWEKRGKDAYRLTVCIGTDFKGEPIRYRKTVHCKTDKQADKELAKFYAACEAGDVSKSYNARVSAFCDLYIDKYGKIKLEKTTLAGYRSVIKIHIKPILGDFYLSKIRRIQVQEWVNYLHEDKELSPKSVKNIFSVLDGIMTTAIKWGYIATNPCDYIDLPPLRKKEADFYNREETLALLKALEAVPEDELKFKVGVEFALLCGYRKSEIMGLDWDVIDFEKGTAKVVKKRVCIIGEGVIEGVPKTSKSARTTTMPQELIDDLKRLRLQQKKQKLLIGSKWVDSGAVLINGFGGQLYPPAMAEWFSSFLEANNLRHISLHKLRHTHASLLAYLGTDVKNVSERLGHSQPSTTLNIYTHLFVDTDREIADQISSSLYQKDEKIVRGDNS